MLAAYQGHVRDGRIQLEIDTPLPEGARVLVVVDTELEEDAPAEGVSGAELLAADFIGVWADRDDIGDTAEFVEKLRRRAERRE